VLAADLTYELLPDRTLVTNVQVSVQDGDRISLVGVLLIWKMILNVKPQVSRSKSSLD
jgi:hypothetical protein